MAYSYKTKWMKNAFRGAPPVSGTPGTFLAALRAFLVTGYGALTATSVTISGGVGTATFPSGSFSEHSVVSISGATAPTSLNGEARVLTAAANSITFSTDAPDGTATGSIVFKFAPVGGWEELFTGTNQAVFRSTDVTGARSYFRIDDSSANYALLTGFESMSDINSGSGPFPSLSAAPVGGYIFKSSAGGTSPVNFYAAGDSKSVHFAIEEAGSYGPQYRGTAIRGFGEAISLAPSGDAWCSYVSARSNNSNGYFNAGALTSSMESESGSGFTCMPRAFSGLGAAVLSNPRPVSGTANNVSGIDNYFGPGPSNVDGQIKLSRMTLGDKTSTNFTPRAYIPGLLYVPQSGVAAVMTPGQLMSVGAGPLAGRKLLGVAMSTSAFDSNLGFAFIDVTGDWR